MLRQGYWIRGLLVATAFAVVAGLAISIPAAALTLFASMFALAIASAPTRKPSVPAALDSEADVVAEARGEGIDAAAVIGGLAEPLFIVSHSLEILACNKAAHDLFGPTLVGEAITVFLRHPGAVEAIRESVRLETAQEQELHLLSPIERSYALRVAPLGDDSQRYIISLRDITALRLAERMRVDFVANASHELRTPLSTVMGFIETLQGAAADDSAARVRFLDIMGQEADRMSRLIDDLLSLSRVELDNQAPPSAPIELAPVLADVGKTLAVRLGADARSLKVSVPPDLPMVLADRDQILQVVHNLVSNSIKYGRAGTPIEIEADVAPAAEDGGADVIRVSVRDKGEGIAPEHLPRLTERFYRIDNARSRRLGGTGLGLAIVKHILERHQGTLGISSTLGVGTTVTFTLPISEAGGISTSRAALS
ncbi:MAG: PAS domain-containing protein [Sphingomonadales bacterium]|nr:MAG: PAS domain-containing protein [Sphingomonadales bacterium]